MDERVNRNDKGFTLVELVLAMGMSAVVLSTIAYFMFVGSNSYKMSHAEATMQSEAQIMMNQITERAYLFSDALPDSGLMANAKYLRLFTKDGDGNVVGGNTFWLDKAGGANKLYVFDEYVEDADLPSLSTRREEGYLGNFVVDMSAEVKVYGKYRNLYVSLLVEKDGKRYETNSLVRFRNQ